MNDNRPGPEMLIALYAASAATVAIGSLAKVGGISGHQIDELADSLKMCTARSTGFAAVDQHLAALQELLGAAQR